MKLYRAKVLPIATDCIDTLVRDGDIEVEFARRDEAIADVAAIMEDYLRRDMALREVIRDRMATDSVPYDQYGKTRSKMADERMHPLGDDVERFLARQTVEMLLNSPNVDEVFADDKTMYTKLLGLFRGHDVNEEEIREEARGRIKNIAEGTVDYEIAMRNAVRDVKKRRGLV
jgi:hypothetical protein